MKIKKWKEVKPKEKGIILFTILSILLIIGVFFYQSFAIFKTNENQDLIEGNVENMGDLEFAFYVDDKLVKDINEIPQKNSDYSLDTSSSYCMDVLNHKQISTVNWDNENREVKVKNIENTKTKCYLHFKKIYKETILNEAIPDLGNGRLVPVKISETEKPTDITYSDAQAGKVTKASITDEWYSYANQKWANAVILKDESKTYQDNEEIPESNIESYFVWIPRFEYQLWNGEEETLKFTSFTIINQAIADTSTDSQINQQQKTEIKFATKNTEIKNGNVKGTWLTHPAFTSFNSNGFWVGKFETGYEDASSAATAMKNEINSDKIIIKPNAYSWRAIQVGNAFYTVYDYKRELDSHMMKNMEWGAVAYLANSEYGLCKSGTCTNIMINNNSNIITGYAANKQPTCGVTGINEDCHNYEGTVPGKNGQSTYNYNDPHSVSASTTGNYTGVYDMSGGAWEYVMGVSLDQSNTSPLSGPNKTNNSKLNGIYGNDQTETKLTDGLPWPNTKYYDTYEFNTGVLNFQRGKLGDATKEVGPFYQIQTSSKLRQVGVYYADHAYFVSSTSPWFVRGGDNSYGSDAGIMAFGYYTGQTSNFHTYRIVLTP